MKTRLLFLCQIAVVLAPLLFLVYWIHKFALDMPYLDSWALVPTLQKFYDGTLTWRDLLAQHNENRIPFLRLLVIAQALVTGWNTNYELPILLLLAGLVCLLLAGQSRRACRESSVKSSLWLPPVISLMVFSAMQYESWTFGLTIVGFMNYLAVVVGFILLARPEFKWRHFSVALLCGAIAMYSYSNGILFWGIGLLLLLVVMRAERRWIIVPFLVMACLGAALAAGFFAGYKGMLEMPPVMYYLKNLNLLLDYFFTLLGGGVANALFLPERIPWIMGVAVCIIFIGTGLFMLFQPAPVLRAVSFWLALGIYAALTAAAVAVGRCLFFGVSNALSSRYVTISSPFWIATLVLAVIAIKRMDITVAATGRRRVLHIVKGAGVLFGVICAGLFVVSSFDALNIWHARHERLVPARNELLSFNPDQSLLAHSYTSWQLLQPRIEFLTGRRLSVFRDRKRFEEYEIVELAAGEVGGVSSNPPPLSGFNPNAVQVSGRAYDPLTGKSARAVIMVDDRDMVVEYALVTPRKDLTDSFWDIRLSAAKYPDWPVSLRAYSVLQDGMHIASLGTVHFHIPAPVDYPAFTTAGFTPVEFDTEHGLITGWTDYFRVAGGQVYGRGWARDPVSGNAGEWVLVTDENDVIYGYARVNEERVDVAKQLQAPGMLRSGWSIALADSRLPAGRYAMRAWLLLPEARRALKLNNEFEITVLNDAASIK